MFDAFIKYKHNKMPYTRPKKINKIKFIKSFKQNYLDRSQFFILEYFIEFKENS